MTQFAETFKAEDAKTAPKATIYVKSEFFGNLVAKRVKLLGYGTQKYAQYNNAPYVVYIEKGKRKAYKIVQGYNPSLLIVEGWDAPAPDSLYGEPEQTATATISRGRYAAFDSRWQEDFNAKIASADVKIIADFRKEA